MECFKKLEAQWKKIKDCINYFDKQIETLDKYDSYVDIGSLKKIRNAFIEKTDDFNRSDRKLNVGVIGQVKSGKSTFLNTLLFNGEEILPTSRTPKTAALTKIEYSENNVLDIEYYTENEWDILVRYSKEDKSDNEHTIAKEIMEMVAENNLNPLDYISKIKETIEFDSVDSIKENLNDYVGENGKYTPFVKNVTIRFDIPELNEISIVDTPGLNDAIASRTDRTREFIEKCDVVFFLSRASAFLDVNDMKLVTSQLPSKGVENLVLVCSQFDSGLMDVIRNMNSIQETIDSVKNSLTTRVNEIISENAYCMNEKTCEQFRKVKFISSIAYTASGKEESIRTPNEKLVVKRLNKLNDLTDEILTQIGNFDEIKEEFKVICNEKDEILQNKSENFIPLVKTEWNNSIGTLCDGIKTKVQILDSGDKDEIEKNKKMVSSQICGIKSALENVLGELNINLEKCKTDNLKKLRENCHEYSHIEEKQGTEYHVTSYMAGQKSFLFWSWGGHREYSTYTTSYTYLDTADALANIREFGHYSCSDIESTFTKTLDLRSTKTRLIQTILNNFDSSDESFDINYYKQIVETTVNAVEFPVVKIDIEPFITHISASFSGEIRDSNNRSELKRVLADSIEKLYDEVVEIFTNEVLKFRKVIFDMKEDFSEKLLSTINNDFEILLKQLEDKENEIENYKNVQVELKNAIVN